MPGEENDKCQSRCYHSKYDDGIMIGAYVGYERKCGDWSCDLLFGKGLLAPENWTIPQKELHGLSVLAVLANLKKQKNLLLQKLEKGFLRLITSSWKVIPTQP
jgi:hypothetical protein